MGSPSQIGPALGTVLAQKYRIDSELAAGGMGRVVRAHHLLLDKPVAIKFVMGVAEAGRARQRFLGEARAAQALSSEHVLRVYDVGIEADQPYIVMELLDGLDLGSLVEQSGPLALDRAADHMLAACRGLAEAHAAGIVHRDIKPSNLFLARTVSGQPLIKVLDFGISKFTDKSASSSGESTRSDVLLGSPYYMSPEQLRNPAKVDARTDVWSLGVTLHYLLTGDHPFAGDTLSEVTAAVFTEPHRSLASRPDLPAEVQGILDRALTKRPEERTPSVHAFARELAPYASEQGRWIADRLSHDSVPATLEESQPIAEPDPLAPTEAETAREISMPTTRTLGDAPAVVPVHGFPIWRVLAAAAAVLLTLAGVLWARAGSKETASQHVAAEPPTLATASTSAPAPSLTLPAPAEATSHEPTPSASASSEPQPKAATPNAAAAQAPTKAPAVRVKKSAGDPPAPQAGSPEPKKRPVDVDGIPIVE